MVKTASYPPTIKPKAYRASIRDRFCEAILAKRILITEGRTEYDAFSTAARRLHELCPERYKTLEALGIAVLDAQTDSQVAPLGEHFRNLGKVVFAVFDKQNSDQKAAIEKAVKYPYESPEKNFEELIVNGTSEASLKRFAISLVEEGEWPSHLVNLTPSVTSSIENIRDALRSYLKHAKGSYGAADLLYQCSRDEMPQFIIDTLESIQSVVESSQKQVEVVQLMDSAQVEAIANEEKGQLER